MSHIAISRPLMAALTYGPTRQNAPRYILCQWCVMRRGSCPIERVFVAADGLGHDKGLVPQALAPPHNALIGFYLHEQPPGLHGPGSVCA